MAKPIQKRPVVSSRDEFAKAPSDTAVLRKTFGAQVTEVPETRSLRFTISTAGIDRDNDIIEAKGWDLTNYLKSPVVLWAHKYDELPVAKATNVRVQGDTLVADAEFAPADVYPFADTLYRMVKSGFLSGTSVGFKPKNFVFDEKRQGFTFHSQELLEFSLVPIPANADALLDARTAGLLTDVDIKALTDWATTTLKALDAADAKPIPLATVEIADKGAAWTRPTLQSFTAKSWADLSDAERRTIASHFAYTLKDPPEEFADLHFPHHDPRTGQVVWRAVAASLATLLGDKAVADIPAAEREAIYQHLASHYTAFGGTPPPVKPEFGKRYASMGPLWVAMLSAEQLKALPTRDADEEEQEFVSRCMGSEAMQAEFEDQKQRLAVCYSQARKERDDAKAAKAIAGCSKGDACPHDEGLEYCPADDCPMDKQKPEGPAVTTKTTKATKAGRVLAARNETRLRQAATLLTEVLAELEPSAPPEAEPPTEAAKGLPAGEPVLLILDDEPVVKAPEAANALESLDAPALRALLSHAVTQAVDKALTTERLRTTGELD